MQLEHANITINNIDSATRFIQTVFPDATVLREGPRTSGGVWRHVGVADQYIALQQEQAPAKSTRTPYVENGINHIGFVVNDFADVKQRLQNANFELTDMGCEEEGRSSLYVFDDTGIEWEIVQYPSR